MSRALVIGAVAALVAACSVEVDVAGKGCPCVAGYICDEARSLCVPLALAKAICGDDCPCSTNADCTDPERSVCSPSAKKCVECDPGATVGTCKAGTVCNAQAQCTPGCSTNDDCKGDPATPTCAVDRRQCVGCLTDADCGGKRCSPSGTCVDGCGAGEACKDGKECCEGLCLDFATDRLNCGACGNRCVADVNGQARCDAGKCEWTCASGFGHCMDGNTGCETNLRNDPAHCGACPTVCRLPNANQRCVSGGCVVDSCLAGFADKDEQSANGCEQACGKKGLECCPGPVRCSEGMCVGNGTCK